MAIAAAAWVVPAVGAGVAGVGVSPALWTLAALEPALAQAANAAELARSRPRALRRVMVRARSDIVFPFRGHPAVGSYPTGTVARGCIRCRVHLPSIHRLPERTW